MPPSKRPIPKPKPQVRVQTTYQKAISNPKSAGTSKLRPYDAKWKAKVKTDSAKYDKSTWNKVGKVVEFMSPVYFAEPVLKAVTGRNPLTKKKSSRALAIAEIAGYAVGARYASKALKPLARKLGITKVSNKVKSQSKKIIPAVIKKVKK